MLRAEGLAAFRGERLVFRDLSFDVPPSGALLLLGPNGSGKSTLLRILAGLGRLAAGVLRWDGEDALADRSAHAGRVAYLGHLDAIKPGLTVTENLRFAGAIAGRPIAPALAAVGLDTLADLPARLLSAGQRRRLALARLALSPAKLWLLDEPTLGLDAASVERLGATAGGTPGRRRDCRRRDASAATAGRSGGVASGVRIFAALLARELRLSLRHGADTLAAVLFFVVAASLFPLAIGPAPETLSRMAPGIVWVCALLAAILPLDRLFGADYEDGALDQLLLSGLPAAAIAAAKALAHWLVTGLPLLIVAAPLAVMLRLEGDALPVLIAGLLPGTLLLSLIGTVGAAVVLGARRGGVLLPLLVLPLTTPVLIFGVAAADAASGGLSPRPHLLLLAALLAAALPLAPLAAGAALRGAVE